MMDEWMLITLVCVVLLSWITGAGHILQKGRKTIDEVKNDLEKENELEKKRDFSIEFESGNEEVDKLCKIFYAKYHFAIKIINEMFPGDQMTNTEFKRNVEKLKENFNKNVMNINDILYKEDFVQKRLASMKEITLKMEELNDEMIQLKEKRMVKENDFSEIDMLIKNIKSYGEMDYE